MISVFTHTQAAIYLLSWATVFGVDAFSVVLFSFIFSCQAPSFLFCTKACPFPYFSFSPQVSYPLFFPPYEKNNMCTKGISPSVSFSPPTSLVSVQLFSHLERDCPDPRICPPKKLINTKEKNALKNSENAFVVWYRICEPDLNHWKPLKQLLWFGLKVRFYKGEQNKKPA